MESQFEVGQGVMAVAFRNIDGELIPVRRPLVVTSIKLVAVESVPTYYRVTAEDVDGMGYVEAAEGYFAPLA